jgi:hypothetical protein
VVGGGSSAVGRAPATAIVVKSWKFGCGSSVRVHVDDDAVAAAGGEVDVVGDRPVGRDRRVGWTIAPRSLRT